MTQDFGFDFKPKTTPDTVEEPSIADVLVADIEAEPSIADVLSAPPEPSVGKKMLNAGAAAAQDLGLGLSRLVFQTGPMLRKAVFNEPDYDPEQTIGGMLAAMDRENLPKLIPTDPALESSVFTQTGHAIGSSLSIGAGALAGPVGVAGAGVLQNAIPAYQEAKAKGASDDMAAVAFWLNGGVGVAEAFPMARIFTRVNQQSGGVLKNILIDAPGEMATEAGQQALSDTIAKYTLDEDRPILERMAATLAPSGLSAAILSGLASAASRKPKAGTNKEDFANLDVPESPAVTEGVTQEPSPAAPATQGSEPIVSEPAPLDDPDIAAALEAARPKPLDVPAAMPTETGLFGQQERKAKPAPKVPEQSVRQGMLLDVQEGDLPGQKSLLDEEFQEPTFEEQLADKSLHPWIGGLAEEAGQAQVGGMLLRDADRNVIGRTKWAPKSEWWNERPLPKQFPEKRFKAVIDKMLAGKKLGSAERQVAEFVLHKAGSQKAAFEAEQRYLASQPVEAVDEERAAIQSANEPVPTRRILRAKKIADLSAEIDRSFRDLGRKAKLTPFSGPGLDPERVAAVAKIASLYVQKGYLKAEQFIEDVVSKLGEEMRPYAEAAWRLASEPSSQGVSPTQPQAGPEGAVEPKVVAAPPQPPAEATPADQPSPIDFTLAPETATETIRRKMEDYFIRPRKVLGQVKAQGARVEEASDVSLKQDLASNKAAARVERVMDRQRAAVKLIAAGKIPLEESTADLPSVREFFVARHAEARNAALMQGENPRGLDMEENPGSGMATSRARAILAQAAASPAAEQYAALGRLVDGVLATKRRRQVESGLESEESIAAYEAKYGPSYVPLKTAQPGGRPIPTSGKSLQVRGRENRSAQGRESLADNPLVMALRDAAETEVRAENNLVGQSLGKLITDNPSPLWELYDSTAAIPAEDVKAGNVFTFKENGNERYAVVRDQKFVEAMKGLAPANQHEWVRAIGKLARIYKQLHTTWNFAFPASNLQRDIGSAGLNLAAREVKGFGKGALKRIPATIKAGIQLASDPDAKGQTADYLREYRETGGKIGWVEPRAFEDQIALIQKDIDVEAGKAPTRKALRRLRDLVEGANEVVESSTRAAAYIEARKRGYSKDRSASIALHVSTPFSRRGEWGPTMNALWLFSQAQIQGSVNMARTLRGPAGRRIAAGLVAAGFATSLLNRYGGGEDEERGVPYWDTYEQDTKSRYFRLLIPGTEGKSVGFALPWGFSTLFYMGTLAEELSAGSIDEGQAAMKLATSALQSVSPVSGADPMQALTPWFARPAWELYTNKKYSGAPITPAAEPYDRTPEPRYKRNFKSAGDTSIAVAELLNKVTGGDDVTPGALDVSGSQVGYVGEQLGGGLGRSTLRLYSAAERFLSGEPTPFSTVPLFNTVVGEPSEYFDSKRYFENLSTLEVARERRKAGKELDPEQRAALKHDLSAKAIEKQIESQRKLLKTARKDETKKAIGERIEKLRQQLNRRFAEAAK